MTTHIASVSFIGRRQKTAKTCCGLRVSAGTIAVDEDATCEGCRQVRDKEREGYLEVSKNMKAMGLDTKDLDDALEGAKPLHYRTEYFL